MEFHVEVRLNKPGGTDETVNLEMREFRVELVDPRLKELCGNGTLTFDRTKFVIVVEQSLDVARLLGELRWGPPQMVARHDAAQKAPAAGVKTISDELRAVLEEAQLTPEQFNALSMRWDGRDNPIEVTTRTLNTFQNFGMTFVYQTVEEEEEYFTGPATKPKGFGRKSLNEVREILHEYGLRFGMKREVDIVRRWIS